MLSRLEAEDARIQQLVSTGELSPQGTAMSAQLVTKAQEELLSELRKLEIEDGEFKGSSPNS